MPPSVSIIVPIYNVEKYLRQCLDTLINQTKKDIEIICINDGSTDSSLQILQEYAKKDSRISIIDKKNEGLGKAYNEGLDRAQGKYIGFVESDDYIDKTMYEKLFQAIEEDQSDVVKCNFYYVDQAGHVKEPRYTIFAKKRDIPLTAVDPILYQDIFLGHPTIWACLYRMETLRKYTIRFMETPGASFQDAPFWLDTMSSVQKISFIQPQLYYYRIHQEQSTFHGKPHFWRDIFIQYDKTLETMRIRDREKYALLLFIRFRRSLGEYAWAFGRLQKKYIPELNQYIQMDYGDGKYDKMAHKLLIIERILYFIFRNNMSYILYIAWKFKKYVF